MTYLKFVVKCIIFLSIDDANHGENARTWHKYPKTIGNTICVMGIFSIETNGIIALIPSMFNFHNISITFIATCDKIARLGYI